jgi:hypothetical protein
VPKRDPSKALYYLSGVKIRMYLDSPFSEWLVFFFLDVTDAVVDSLKLEMF